jgi:DNA primase
MVDTKTLLERVDVAALIEHDLGQPVRREGRWLKWTCPFHDDRKTPSLGVAGNRWKCFGCGRSGDAIDWMRERKGLSFQEACQRLGSIDLVPTSKKAASRQPPSSLAPAAAWQDLALEVVRTCQAVLWSDDGTKARVWLSRRDLANETIRRWRLGFNPDDQKFCSLWVPRGIVIPCLVAGRIWYLKVRRANGRSKYSQVSGGQIACSAQTRSPTTPRWWSPKVSSTPCYCTRKRGT